MKLRIESIERLFRSKKPIVINSDVRTAIKKIPTASIDLIVTSPPYWNQRDYEHNDEIGKEETVEQYIQTMFEINSELKRVLKDTGVYFLNIGDKYVNKELQMIPEDLAMKMRKEDGWVIRSKVIWHKTNPNPCPVTDRFTNAYEMIYMFVKGTNSYLTPDYYFDLDSIRIPHTTKDSGKNTELPRIIEIKDFDRFTKKIKTHEYNGKFKDQKRINIGASAGGRVSVNGEYYTLQRKYRISAEMQKEIIVMLRKTLKSLDISIPDIDKELKTKGHTASHWFRLDRGGRSLPSPEKWIKLKKILKLKKTKYDKIMTDQHYVLQTVRNHEKGKNPSDVWNMSTSSIKEKHFAPFPEKLPERCIKACCPDDGVVLDPFCGSGTTLKVASSLNRKSIGIEINAKNLDIIKRIVGDVNVLKL